MKVRYKRYNISLVATYHHLKVRKDKFDQSIGELCPGRDFLLKIIIRRANGGILDQFYIIVFNNTIHNVYVIQNNEIIILYANRIQIK
jgi:hypothetical protein